MTLALAQEVPEVGLGALALAALLVLGHGVASVALDLGIGRKLLVAALRATVQLALLGLVLEWLLATRMVWVVLLAAAVMATAAGVEGVRRSSRRLPGVWAVGIGVVLVSSLTVTVYGVRAVLGVEPWWTPRFLLPILGMVLGNTLNGIALGLDTALEGFDRDRDRVELLLAHGATRREAARDVVRRAVRRGLVPILNAMAVAGLVSIPGMMTGQILGGSPPGLAARYQLFILFCIAGGTALGTVGAVLGVTRLVFDERDRLRTDRIRVVQGA